MEKFLNRIFDLKSHSFSFFYAHAKNRFIASRVQYRRHHECAFTDSGSRGSGQCRAKY